MSYSPIVGFDGNVVVVLYNVQDGFIKLISDKAT